MSTLMEPTNANNIELKATLQQLPLDLSRDAVETDVALRINSLRLGRGSWRRRRCGRHGAVRVKKKETWKRNQG